MVDTVRAVHTFVAEHGDELEFQAGELIHVLERDDGFGDGWWRGRNERGDEGLFPATYISEQTEMTSNEPVDTSAQDTRLPVSPVIPNDTEPEEKAADTPVVASTPPSPTAGRAAPLALASDPALSALDTHHPPADQITPLDNQPAHNSVNGDSGVKASGGDVRGREASLDDNDLAIGLDTRARLAEQAKLANEQRDRSRMSGGVTGLVYSDESEDEDEGEQERFRTTNHVSQMPAIAGETIPLGDPEPSKSLPSSIHAASLSEKNLQPALPIPATPPLAIVQTAEDNASAPKTWTVEQVAGWLQDRGFDNAIYSKFREHEITGDVLLELDVNLLKELDIPQFGKRMRVAQAIAELRSQSGTQALPAVKDQPSNDLRAAEVPTGLSTPPTSAPTESAPFSAWAHSRRASSTTPTVPSMEAIKEGQSQTNHSSVSSIPTTPVTPNSALTKRESVGSMGHRKGKASVDNKDRLSFFGRNRKPPPPAVSPGEPKASRMSASGGRVHQMQPMTVDSNSRGPNAMAGSAGALRQIGVPDHSGYMKKKGERYGWKTRFFVLKGSHLYYMRSEHEDRVKGNIDLRGCRVIVDENTNPGSYGFRLTSNDKSHAFSSSEQTTIREWMKALMKATIARDYTVPVSSSCNIPTIPLAEAQALAPRPPSPATRDATQRATRRENTNTLTAHDASVLMSLDTSRRASQTMSPGRPSRHNQRPSIADRPMSTASSVGDPRHRDLVDWVNSRLPASYPRASSLPGSFVSGEVLFLLVRSLSGLEPSPPVPPSAFHPENGMPGLSGLFAMMDIMIDAGVDTAGVSINDVRQGDVESIRRLVESVKAWDQQRSGVAQ